jgi:hypothetical protein
LTQSLPFAQHVITHSQKKSEKLSVVVSSHQELAALDKRISDEKTKNCYLQRELDMLKQERTRETWLLKNDLQNSELQKQLKEQQAEYQEQLKEEKKRTKVGPRFPRVLFLNNFPWLLKYLHRRA